MIDVYAMRKVVTFSSESSIISLYFLPSFGIFYMLYYLLSNIFNTDICYGKGYFITVGMIPVLLQLKKK